MAAGSQALSHHIRPLHQYMEAAHGMALIFVMALQVLPVILNIRQYSARLEFFRSLAEDVHTLQVQHYPPTINECFVHRSFSKPHMYMHASICLQVKCVCMFMQGVCNFVDTGKEPITSVEGLTQALGQLEGEEHIGSQGIQLYDTDHVIGPKGMTISTLQAHQKANRSAVAVLYGAVGTPGFKELHDTLVQSASSGEHSPKLPLGIT